MSDAEELRKKRQQLVDDGARILARTTNPPGAAIVVHAIYRDARGEDVRVMNQHVWPRLMLSDYRGHVGDLLFEQGIEIENAVRAQIPREQFWTAEVFVGSWRYDEEGAREAAELRPVVEDIITRAVRGEGGKE